MSTLKSEEVRSLQISVLHNALNLEVIQILYITFLIRIDSCNERDSTQSMSILENNEIINFQKFQYRIAS